MCKQIDVMPFRFHRSDGCIQRELDPCAILWHKNREVNIGLSGQFVVQRRTPKPDCSIKVSYTPYDCADSQHTTSSCTAGHPIDMFPFVVEENR
jgi:hypothetical protein